MGVMQDEVFDMDELAFEPERGSRVSKMLAFDKTVADRCRFYFPISNARTSYAG